MTACARPAAIALARSPEKADAAVGYHGHVGIAQRVRNVGDG